VQKRGERQNWKKSSGGAQERKTGLSSLRPGKGGVNKGIGGIYLQVHERKKRKKIYLRSGGKKHKRRSG